jgi:hypothetical protein
MVLSRRLVVFLMVLVVVMALGIIGVLGAVGSASPDNAPLSTTPKRLVPSPS